jgi:DegV family protein with EDD domain
MAGIRVVTDSACDLPDDVVAEHQVTIVPLSIRFGDTELVDRRDLTTEEFWARCATSPVLPETAAPSPGAFAAAFRALADEGAEGVVCINLSSRLSATIQAAQAATKEVAAALPVQVLDSKTVSLGQGIQVLAAARMAAQGKSMEDVVGAVGDLVARTRLIATLDTLENLKKGGRIGGAQAFLGSMLSIKPVIQVIDGVVEQESRQRTRSRSLKYLADRVAAAGAVESVSVMHAQAPDLSEFLDLLGAVTPRDKILVGQVGAVIGTHAGLGAIGCAFLAPPPS